MSVIISVAGKVNKADDMRYTPSGTAVLSFSFAKKSGTGDKAVFSWYKASLWGTLAENMSGKLEIGTRFFLTGRQKTRLYEKKDGTSGAQVEIDVMDIELLDYTESAKQEKPAEDNSGEEEIPF